MKIVTRKGRGLKEWYAECPELPGSSPVGSGKSKLMAVTVLLMRMGIAREQWFKYVDQEKLFVDGVQWFDCNTIKR